MHVLRKGKGIRLGEKSMKQMESRKAVCQRAGKKRAEMKIGQRLGRGEQEDHGEPLVNPPGDALGLPELLEKSENTFSALFLYFIFNFFVAFFSFSFAPPPSPPPLIPSSGGGLSGPPFAAVGIIPPVFIEGLKGLPEE